jgi:hypothetical protein
VIDVSVMKATSNITRARVVVSGHKPVVAFEQTWNDPPGSGPFKQMIFLQFDPTGD